MFSKTCEYALRAILYVALNASKGKKIGIKEIAKNLGIPTHFLGKILQNLVKHRILDSTKGPNGGFFSTPAMLKIPIIRIVEIVDGKETFNKCGIGLAQCSDKHPCPIHNDFGPYRDNLKRILSKKKVQDFVNEIKKGGLRL